jgi:hypothetical protein
VPVGTPTSIGTGVAPNGTDTSCAFATTAAVPAGNSIIVGYSYIAATQATLADNGAGGSQSWQVVFDQVVAVSNKRLTMWRADPPNGLASGVTITATPPAASNNQMICGVQVSGLAKIPPVKDTSNGATGSAAGYSSGNLVTSSPEELLYAVVFKDTSGVGHTPTAPATEIHEFTNATQATMMASEYRIVTALGTYTLDGTWGNANEYIVGAVALAGAPVPSSPSQAILFPLRGAIGPAGLPLMPSAPSEVFASAVTTLSDSDSGTGTETSDVQATVPGSDTSSGSETETVAATVSDSDSGTGTDGQVSIVSPLSGTDSGTGSESGTVSATASGSESSSGTDAGTVSATAAGSDAATGTDTGSASVSAPGSDSATGTEGSVVTETGAGGEGGAGSDTGTVSVTAAGSDSGTGTDAGTVVDVTGGPTAIAGSDSGTGTESGTVVDLTPPAPPDTGGGGPVDESAIYGAPETFRALTGHDRAVALDIGTVVDLTPRPKPRPLRVILPRRRDRPRDVEALDGAVGREDAVLAVDAVAADGGRAMEAGHIVDLTPEDPDEILMVMALLFD